MMGSLRIPHDSRGGRQRKIPVGISRMLLLCCLLMAFDFKGREAGGWYQVTAFTIVLFLLGAVGLVLSSRRASNPNRKLRWGFAFLILFIAWSCFVAYVQNVPLANYQSMIAPYLLLVFSYGTFTGLCRHFGATTALREIFPKLTLLFVLSLGWTLYQGTQIDNVTVETMRYRAVSALIPFAIAYFVSGAVSKILTKWELLIATAGLIIIVIGQTRSYLLTLAIAILLVPYAHSPRNTVWLRKAALTLLVGAALTSVLFFALGLFQNGTSILGASNWADAWANRLFGSIRDNGFDLTTSSRLAEYDNQMLKLFSSTANSLLGLGLGGPYTYSGIHADRLASVLGENQIPEAYWNGGHSLWVYTLYANGLVFGTAFLGFVVYIAWIATRMLISARRLGRAHERHKIVTVAAGYLCILSTGFTSFPLGSRALAFLLGILMALLIGLGQTMSERSKALVD